MAYPKPLSEKTLSRKYGELSISSEKLEFLKKFYNACICLYGFVSVREALEVYGQIAHQEGVPALEEDDFYEPLDVFRRDGTVPFFIAYDEEVMEGDPEAGLPEETVIAHRNLMYTGRQWLYRILSLGEVREEMGIPFYIPDHFMSIQSIPVTEEEKELAEYLGNLRARGGVIRDFETKEIPKPSRYGPKLSTISYISATEQFIIDMIHSSGNDKNKKLHGVVDQIWEKAMGKPASLRILDTFKTSCYLGQTLYKDALDQVETDLRWLGVSPRMWKKKDLRRLCRNAYESFPLWITYGWPVKVKDYTKMVELPAPDLSDYEY